RPARGAARCRRLPGSSRSTLFQYPVQRRGLKNSLRKGRGHPACLRDLHHSHRRAVVKVFLGWYGVLLKFSACSRCRGIRQVVLILPAISVISGWHHNILKSIRACFYTYLLKWPSQAVKIGYLYHRIADRRSRRHHRERLPVGRGTDVVLVATWLNRSCQNRNVDDSHTTATTVGSCDCIVPRRRNDRRGSADCS